MNGMRRLVAIGALVVGCLLGCRPAEATQSLAQGYVAALTGIVDPGGNLQTFGACTITQTTVTLSANVQAQIVAANTARKWLTVWNIGTALANTEPGTATMMVGVGAPLTSASGAGDQGGSVSVGPLFGSTQAFSAISASGTTLLVWECQ